TGHAVSMPVTPAPGPMATATAPRLATRAPTPALGTIPMEPRATTASFATGPTPARTGPARTVVTRVQHMSVTATATAARTATKAPTAAPPTTRSDLPVTTASFAMVPTPATVR